MRILKNLGLACGAALLATSASAAVINGEASGLANPDGFINFSEVDVGPGTIVTDQFAELGVSFDAGVSLVGQGTARPNFSGDFALNFGNVGGSFVIFDPLQIIFSQTVSAASFATTNNNGNNTVFTAFLGDTSVASFNTDVARPTGPGNENNIYGFENLTFDRIEYDITSGNRTFGLDSISFNVAAVPLPAGLPLMLLGLGAFAALRRKKA